jgi:rhodanese-related sulfurtransferase
VRLLASVCLALIVVPVSVLSYTDIPKDTLINWITNGPPADFILIDVRDSATEVAPRGIIGTDSCRPYNLSWNQGVFKPAVAAIPVTMPVVVYCAAGGRSPLAAAYLDTAVHLQHVYNLLGGFGGWSGATMAAASVKPRSEFAAASMHAHPGATVQWFPVRRERSTTAMGSGVNVAAGWSLDLLGRVNHSSGTVVVSLVGLRCTAHAKSVLPVK